MTTVGKICMVVIMITSIAGMLFCSVQQRGQTSAGRRGRRSLQDGAKRVELTGQPVVFRAGELRFVNCKASKSHRIEDAEIYGAQAQRYERETLACILADQLMAAGAIVFSEEDGVLRAELKAVLPK